MSDLIFPLCPGYSFEGGPRYSTSIVSYGGGRELRNRNNTYPLHDWVVTATRKQSEIEALRSFFHQCGGRAEVFLFKDWGDFKSCATGDDISATDQLLGYGGTDLAFPLIKAYGSGDHEQLRLIPKPKAGTLTVAIDGMVTSAWSFDDDTGSVVLDAYAADGAVVTAGFEFWVPARFDADNLQMVIENLRVASISVAITEVRL